VECIDCHGHQGSTIEHNEGREATASTTVDPVFVNVQVSQAFSLSGPATYLGSPTTPGDPKRCDNISCHYGLTPDWGMRNFAAPAGTVTPSAGPGIPGTTLNAGTTHNEIDYLVFTHTGAGDVVLSNFRISMSGVAYSPADVTQVQLWESADNAWDGTGVDTHIGTAIWKGAYYEPASAISYNVSSNINVLVTADIASDATHNNSFEMDLTTLQASWGNIGSFNTPQSNTFAINNPVSLTSVVITATPGSQTPLASFTDRVGDPTAQLYATGIYSDASTADLTDTIGMTWSSATANTLTVGNTQGVDKGLVAYNTVNRAAALPTQWTSPWRTFPP
jgi:hypothetical protein